MRPSSVTCSKDSSHSEAAERHATACGTGRRKKATAGVTAADKLQVIPQASNPPRKAALPSTQLHTSHLLSTAWDLHSIAQIFLSTTGHSRPALLGHSPPPLLTWKFPVFLSYFTRLFLSNIRAAV